MFLLVRRMVRYMCVWLRLVTLRRLTLLRLGVLSLFVNVNLRIRNRLALRLTLGEWTYGWIRPMFCVVNMPVMVPFVSLMVSFLICRWVT